MQAKTINQTNLTLTDWRLNRGEERYRQEARKSNSSCKSESSKMPLRQNRLEVVMETAAMRYGHNFREEKKPLVPASILTLGLGKGYAHIILNDHKATIILIHH